MKSIVTNAAEITVLGVRDERTYKTGGGPVSIGLTVVESSKGPVGEVIQCTHENWMDKLGKPFHRNIGTRAEGLRHLEEALREATYCNVVRVLAQDARFPSLALRRAVDKGDWTLGVSYVVGDVVNTTYAKFICIQDHVAATSPTLAVPGAQWAVYTTPIAVARGAWAATTEYVVNDVVTVSGGSLICIIAHTSGDAGTAPTLATPGANWKVYTAPLLTSDKGAWVTATNYVPNDFITVEGGELLCVVKHLSAGTAPTYESPGTNWVRFAPSQMVKAAHAYGTTLSLGDGMFLHIYPIDGDPCLNRSVEIKNVDNDKKRFDIVFRDKDEMGQEYILKTHTVGIGPNDKDDMGRSAYIQTVLEEQNSYFRCLFDESITWEAIATLSKTAFAGGTNGGIPTTQDYKDAWDTFRNERIIGYLLFAAGCYDGDVLANCMEIAELRHNSFFFDVPPWLDSVAAKDWLVELGLESRQASAYYCPYAARDQWWGGKSIWGASGAVVAACARGDAISSGATPGIHFSPAGERRAKLQRSWVTPLFPSDRIDRDAFYTARINPVVPNSDGSGIMVDDSMALYYKESYLRFVWVNRIANFIDHQFLIMATRLKHEPDGLTEYGLTDGMRRILDPLITSGALVKPRDPDEDGDNPYTLKITQEEIDLWRVQWFFCPTGSARRIVGEPWLVR